MITKLSFEQLQKLPTHRLQAYKKKLNANLGMWSTEWRCPYCFTIVDSDFFDSMRGREFIEYCEIRKNVYQILQERENDS